jgi:hypothetical protein
LKLFKYEKMIRFQKDGPGELMEKGLISQPRKFNEISKRSLVSNSRIQDFQHRTNKKEIN